MIGLSRQEVNLRRLLAKCELMIKSNKDDENFPKYVNSLEEMVREAMKDKNKPADETINHYKKRIYNIKSALCLEDEDDKRFLLNESCDEAEVAREELLGVRQRTVQKGTDDLQQVINYNEDMQEKLANDMLQMTQSLKVQSELANKIIRKDTETITRSAQLTDQNVTRLKSESDKLTTYSQRACKCWLWTMLLVIIVIFVVMVLFMKVVKKK